MKLKCISIENVMPGTIEIGKEYELKEPWRTGYYVVELNGNEINVTLANFETINARLLRLSQTAEKTIVCKPGNKASGTVELLLTDSYIIVYAHTPGSHWNISGNHYKYYHHVNTGEFVTEHLANTKEPVQLKERFLMADFKKIHAILTVKHLAKQ